MLPREPAAGRGRHWHLIQEPISFCQWLRAHDPLVTSEDPPQPPPKEKAKGLRREMGWARGEEGGERLLNVTRGLDRCSGPEPQPTVPPLGEDFAVFSSLPGR